MNGVAEQQPATIALPDGAMTRRRAWVRRAEFSVLGLLALRGIAIGIRGVAPGCPWIGDAERLLGGIVTVVVATGVICWIFWSDAPPGVLHRLAIISIALIATCGPPQPGLPAPWDRLAYLAWAFLMLAVSILVILYLVRGTATATQRDIDARLGIRRTTSR